jgi:hypothetical protein
MYQKSHQDILQYYRNCNYYSMPPRDVWQLRDFRVKLYKRHCWPTRTFQKVSLSFKLWPKCSTVESQGGKSTVNLQLILGPYSPHAEARQGRPRQHAADAQAREHAAAEAAFSAGAVAQAANSSPSTADTVAKVVAEDTDIKDSDKADQLCY